MSVPMSFCSRKFFISLSPFLSRKRPQTRVNEVHIREPSRVYYNAERRVSFRTAAHKQSMKWTKVCARRFVAYSSASCQQRCAAAQLLHTLCGELDLFSSLAAVSCKIHTLPRLHYSSISPFLFHYTTHRDQCKSFKEPSCFHSSVADNGGIL